VVFNGSLAKVIIPLRYFQYASNPSGAMILSWISVDTSGRYFCTIFACSSAIADSHCLVDFNWKAETGHLSDSSIGICNHLQPSSSTYFDHFFNFSAYGSSLFL